MNSFYEKHSVIINKLLTATIVLALIYIIVTKLFVWFAPFIVAFLITSFMEPMVSFMEKKLKFSRQPASLISILIVVSVFGTLLALLVIRGYKEAWDLAINITRYVTDVNSDIYILYRNAQNLYLNLPPQIISTIQDNLRSISGFVSTQLINVLRSTVGSLSYVPKIALFILITLISTYFMSSDRAKIREFIYIQVPDTIARRLHNVKTDILKSMVGYLKALSILMTLTFVELTIGLSIIGVKYAIVFAVIISLVDALPVLGTGTILIPWALWEAVTGDLRKALFILILYIIILAVRQLFEPKIVGSQVGLHPLVTLMSIYLGLNLLGVAGMILGPISMILIKNLQKAGIIALWHDEQQ